MEKIEKKIIKINRNHTQQGESEREKLPPLNNIQLEYLLKRQFVAFSSFPKLLAILNNRIIEKNLYVNNLFRGFPYQNLIVYLIENLTKKVEKTFEETFEAINNLIFKLDPTVKKSGYFISGLKNVQKSKVKILENWNSGKPKKLIENEIIEYLKIISGTSSYRIFDEQILECSHSNVKNTEIEESLATLKNLLGGVSLHQKEQKKVEFSDLLALESGKKEIEKNLNVAVKGKSESNVVQDSLVVEIPQKKNLEENKFYPVEKKIIIETNIKFSSISLEKRQAKVFLSDKGELIVISNIISNNSEIQNNKSYTINTNFFKKENKKIQNLFKAKKYKNFTKFTSFSGNNPLLNFNVFPEEEVLMFNFKGFEGCLSILKISLVPFNKLMYMSTYEFRKPYSSVHYNEGNFIPPQQKFEIYKHKKFSLVFVDLEKRVMIFFKNFVKSRDKKNKIHDLYTVRYVRENLRNESTPDFVILKKLYVAKLRDYAIIHEKGMILLYDNGKVVTKTFEVDVKIDLTLVFFEGTEFDWQKIEVIEAAELVIIEVYDKNSKNFKILCFRYELTKSDFKLIFVNSYEISKKGPSSGLIRQLIEVDEHTRFLVYTLNKHSKNSKELKVYFFNLTQEEGILELESVNFEKYWNDDNSKKEGDNEDEEVVEVNNITWSKEDLCLYISTNFNLSVFIPAIKFASLNNS